MNDINIIDMPEIEKKFGFKLDSVKKIYFGKDHECRCGCCGDYAKRGERDFDTFMEEVSGMSFVEENIDVSKTAKGELVCINLPIEGSDDECYCLYFGD